MGRLILLIGICLILIGTLITLKVSFNWVGNLPGDFALQWGKTRVYIPITTSIIFSFFLTILLFIFARR